MWKSVATIKHKANIITLVIYFVPPTFHRVAWLSLSWIGLRGIFLFCELKQLHLRSSINTWWFMNLSHEYTSLISFLFFWFPTVGEATLDYTRNIPSWIKTLQKVSATDKPWHLEQFTRWSMTTGCFHSQKCEFIWPPQSMQEVSCIKFPWVTSNPFSFFDPFNTPEKSENGDKNVKFTEENWDFVFVTTIKSQKSRYSDSKSRDFLILLGLFWVRTTWKPNKVMDVATVLAS